MVVQAESSLHVLGEYAFFISNHFRVELSLELLSGLPKMRLKVSKNVQLFRLKCIVRKTTKLNSRGVNHWKKKKIQINCYQLPETLLKHFKAQLFTFEKDTEEENKKVDDEITKIAHNNNIQVESYWGHTLFDPDYLLLMNNGS